MGGQRRWTGSLQAVRALERCSTTRTICHALRPRSKAYLPSRESPHVIAISVVKPKLLAKHCRKGSSFRIKAPLVLLWCGSAGTAYLVTLSSSCRSYIQGPAFGKHTNTPEPTSYDLSLPCLYRWWNAPASSLACRRAKRDPQTGAMEHRHSDNSILMVGSRCDRRYVRH